MLLLWFWDIHMAQWDYQYITWVLLDTWKFEGLLTLWNFAYFCLKSWLKSIFEIWHLFICILLLFLSPDYTQNFPGILKSFTDFFFQCSVFFFGKIIPAQSKLSRLCSTAHQVELYWLDCYLLTRSNCSHSECVHIIWYQTRKSLYYATGCYILHSTTTYGSILYKVVSDCFTSIKALNLTPGESYSGGVYWSCHKQLWSSCTCKKAIYVTIMVA